MRWIKWAFLAGLFLVGALLAGLYLARFRAGYALISESVEINAPPAEVFHFIASPDLAASWIPGLSDVKNLTPGKTGVGAKESMVMEIEGSKTSLEMETMVFDPPRRIELDERPLDSPEMDFLARIVYVIEPTPTGTRITESSRTDYRTALGRMMEPLITQSASKMLHGLLQNLKRVVEQKKK